MKNYLQSITLLKILIFHNFFNRFLTTVFEVYQFPNKNQMVPIMLTFMNSNITKMTGKDQQNHIFQKSKYIYIYIPVERERERERERQTDRQTETDTQRDRETETDRERGEDQEFIHVFYWCIPLDHEIYTKCKKTQLKTYLVMCSGIKS